MTSPSRVLPEQDPQLRFTGRTAMVRKSPCPQQHITSQLLYVIQLSQSHITVYLDYNRRIVRVMMFLVFNT